MIAGLMTAGMAFMYKDMGKDEVCALYLIVTILFLVLIEINELRR
jgi:hypothetical protein